jgi:ABC-type methionine transport system permease subunit
LDIVTLSAQAHPPEDAPFDVVPVHVRFPDWIPGLCSTIGMIIVNLIDKSRLVGDEGGGLSFGGMGGVAWKARLFLFLGFAMMAGGLAGSVVRDE